MCQLLARLICALFVEHSVYIYTAFLTLTPFSSKRTHTLIHVQAIVDVYGEEISPLAPEMVDHLILSFHHFASQSSSGGGGDDEAAFSATQSLDTILAVIDAVEELPQVISALETKLLPLIYTLLTESENSFEYLEHGLSMLSYITYCNSILSHNVWEICGLLLYAFSTWAYDFMKDASTPIINYMTKDIKAFLAGTHHIYHIHTI